MENEKKNNKLYIVIAVSCILVLLGGYIVYDKLISKDDKKSNNEQEKTVIEDNQDNDMNNSFVVVDRSLEGTNSISTIYLADDEYFNDGTKKALFTKEVISMNVLKNKIFYIDNSKKLYIYNIKDGKEETYDLGNFEVNANTEIRPGEKYAIVLSTTGSVFVIDLENKSNYIANINYKGSGIVFDEENSIFYYSTGDGNIYQYNIINKDSSLVKELKGLPVFQDNRYVFSESSDNGVVIFYSLDKETHKVEKLNIDDFTIGHVTVYEKINDSLFITKEYDKLVEYKNDKESSVLEAGYIKILKIGNKLYVAEYIVDDNPNYEDGTNWKLKEVYTYDIDNSKLETFDNQFSKDLFDKYEVYNMYE